MRHALMHGANFLDYRAKRDRIIKYLNRGVGAVSVLGALPNGPPPPPPPRPPGSRGSTVIFDWDTRRRGMLPASMLLHLQLMFAILTAFNSQLPSHAWTQ